jgi:hypothetical protein
MASSASPTFMIGSVGPKVSSVIAFIEWSTPVMTGRLEEVARAGAALAADDDVRALRARVLDVGLDDVHLRRRGDRADVDGAEAGRDALAQRARLLGDLRDELVVDRLLDVDALDEMQVWPPFCIE